MSITENLEKAKSGNRLSYGFLCNEFADRLYAVAFLVLDTPEEAEEAVKNAFGDSFGSIEKIKDENHLCAWLSRALTKHIVAKLKEYRAEEKTVSDGGISEKALFCRLNDLDRLVCALNLAFGYNTREISVITGLKEETAQRKLSEADKKLGANKETVKGFIENTKAPDSLITKAPKVHDLTVEIDKTDDDGLISEMERIAAFAEAAENNVLTETPEEKPQTAENPPENARLIRFQPVEREEEEASPEPTAEEPSKSEKFLKIKFADFSDIPSPEAAPAETLLAETPPVNEAAPAAEQGSEPVSVKAEEPVSDIAPEETAEAMLSPVTAEPAAEEQPFESPKNDAQPLPEEPAPKPENTEDEAKKEIDAKTFINVITAQRIKGSEFLKLMGNTRISNSVYREIEQNPNLTKDRLVELLEQSPLTSEDYYKVLTAIKQRSEMMTRKEEAKRRLEEAGLFTPPSKREREPEPMPASSDTRSFDVSEAAQPVEAKTEIPEPKPVIPREEPKPEEKPAPKPRLEAKGSETSQLPFSPKFALGADSGSDDDDNLGDEPYNPMAARQKPIPAPKSESKPKKAPAEQPEGKREKYKGREYFINDDVYYPGVNNGKLIFCGVCAVLLIAGSFGIRYLVTGNPLPTDNPASISANAESKKLPAEYLSNGDIYTAISMLEAKTSRSEGKYLRADGEAYSELITKDFKETGDKVYIFNDGKILKYDLSAENPNLFEELAVDESREFLGFTAVNDMLYLLYSDEYTETAAYNVTKKADDGTETTEELTKDIERSRVTVECYENLTLSFAYSQDGDFVNAKIGEESVTVATVLSTAADALKEAEKTYLPSYSLAMGDGESEKSYVGYENITVPEEIGYNSFTVIGTASGGEARAYAVLGGSDGYVEFEGEECRVLIPDKNITVSETFRFIGSRLEKVSSESYTGECFGFDCINDDGTVIAAYDSVNGCTLVQKKIGEEYVTVSGIGTGEKPIGAAYTDKYAYIVTENAEGSEMLYCVDVSGSELISAEADPEAIYTDKLKAYDDELLGLTVEADGDGERTGVKLAVYGYENGLSEKRSVTVTLDENTAPEYIRYLSADAEASNLRIAADETGGFAAISTVYFDGVSEIERILCYKDSGGSLENTTDLLLFDIQSDYRFLTFRENTLYIITDSSVVAVNPETGAPLGYFNENTETEAVSEESTDNEDTVIE